MRFSLCCLSFRDLKQSERRAHRCAERIGSENSDYFTGEAARRSPLGCEPGVRFTLPIADLTSRYAHTIRNVNRDITNLQDFAPQPQPLNQ